MHCGRTLVGPSRLLEFALSWIVGEAVPPISQTAHTWQLEALGIPEHETRLHPAQQRGEYMYRSIKKNASRCARFECSNFNLHICLLLVNVLFVIYVFAGHGGAALHGRGCPRAGHPGRRLDHSVRPSGPNRRVHPQSGANRQRAEREGQVIDDAPSQVVLRWHACVCVGSSPAASGRTNNFLGVENREGNVNIHVILSISYSSRHSCVYRCVLMFALVGYFFG